MSNKITPREAVRFLSTAAVEYASAFAKTNPTVAEALMVRIQGSVEALRSTLPDCSMEPRNGGDSG